MEGPSLIILKSEVAKFAGKPISRVTGTSTINQRRLEGLAIRKFQTWGKHFLIVFKGFYLRIHFLMFGSYRINGRKNNNPRLSLHFDDGTELNFYTCAITETNGSPDKVYDWSADVMSRKWDPKAARKKLRKYPKMSVSDALLDQQIFAGVGNIIKNEILFRIQVHPESLIGNLPPRILTALIKEARNYSFDFLRWKKKFELKKNWLIFTKKKCPRCKTPAIKKYTGKSKRRSFFCTNCQELY